MEPDRHTLVLIAAVVLLVSALAGVLAGGSLLTTESPSASVANDNDLPLAGEPVTEKSILEEGRAVAVAMLEQAGAVALEHTGAGRVTEIEVAEDDGSFEVEVALDDGSEVKVFLDENYQVQGQGADHNEQDNRSITGATLEQATAAALQHTGEGRVLGIELGDDEGVYEVDVTLDDGSEVEVYLNEDFEVVDQR